jgi:phosphoribosylformylglycinamidine synthase subunit PurS
VKHQVVVNVMLKEGIADPQGGTIERALPALGFDGVEGVRVGKRIEFTLDIGDDVQIEERVEAMCRSLLANPVIESYEVIVS